MKKILGITGCPTGVAHTFMAEEALKKAAKALGCEIKVETNGAIGVENQLTTKEIAEADAIIVACDKAIDMDRLNGKPVIEVSVKEGINRAKDLVQQCLDGNVSVRQGDVSQKVSNEGPGLSVGQLIYKHLMNGVSHMLPLVVAGGVLIAISFLWGIYSADQQSYQYNEIAAILMNVGGVSMGIMVPVFTAFIASSIAGRPGMLSGFVAGMMADSTGAGFIGGIIGGFLAGYLTYYLVYTLRKMPRQLEGLKSIFIVPIMSIGIVGIVMLLLGTPVSALNNEMMSFLGNLQGSHPFVLGLVIGIMCAFDMGGPVNKAAYVTGTMLLGQGNYHFMAGVSAACITPPLVIAIAATFFKNRFTEEERSAGLINWILGCTHITEGAIPFAAKSPLKVIPILMLGSSISAILTFLIEIQVPAPHGGFLILGLVDKPFLWVGSILIGSTVGAMLYAVITPTVVAESAQVQVTSEPVSKSAVSSVSSLFKLETIKLDMKASTKDEAIHEMVALLSASNVLEDMEAFKKEIYVRENHSSTGLGMGIAIPHAKTSAVKEPGVAIGISKKGFNFDAVDKKPVHLIFMIAVKDEDHDLHLKTLAKLSAKLMDKDFIGKLRGSTSAQEVLDLLSEEDL